MAPVHTPPFLDDSTEGHIRGSALLLVGRFLSLGTNFLVQMLTVRTLSMSDYGAFAWAMTVVAIATNVVLFGLNRAVARFLPMFHERRDYPSMFGTILLSIGSVVGIGAAVVLTAFGMRGTISAHAVDDPLAVVLLLIVITLAPIQALDALFQNMVAVFARARAIFFRRHVLGPCLRLAAVLLVIALRGDARLLAWGYLVGGALGLLVYLGLLHRILEEHGLTRFLRPSALRVPVREIASFSVPLFTVDLVCILKTSLAAVLLAWFATTTDVAVFRAADPVAGLNGVVLQSFHLLFVPLAARLVARQDTAGVEHLFAHATLWIALLTFPIFALTFLYAEPLAVTMYGARYAECGSVLAVLAFGEYLSATLGLNCPLIQVYGKVGLVVAINLAVVALNLGLGLWLIPLYGALGAALASCISLIAHTLANQAGLAIGIGLRVFHPDCLRAWTSIAAAAVGLSAVQVLWHPPLAVGVVVIAVVSCVLVRLNRGALAVERTFPELLRLPWLAAFLRPVKS